MPVLFYRLETPRKEDRGVQRHFQRLIQFSRTKLALCDLGQQYIAAFFVSQTPYGPVSDKVMEVDTGLDDRGHHDK
jgi:hypothetical protein